MLVNIKELLGEEAQSVIDKFLKASEELHVQANGEMHKALFDLKDACRKSCEIAEGVSRGGR